VTILVNPAQQKQKIGYNLMLRFHEHIKMYMKHILIVQLLPHDINIKAIEMYKRLGYNITHESKRKLRNPDGSFGAQVLMEWINP
jgi:ribosomal protein S18 acetylase RimI-like enzyme